MARLVNLVQVQRYVLLALILALGISQAEPTKAGDGTPHLRVHVYGFEGMSATLLEFAEAESSRIIGHSVPVDWLNCVTGENGCGHEFRDGDMVVRVLSHTQAALPSKALGAAVMGDPAVYAVIAYDRIIALRQNDAPPYATLGKVMAHEITHLLMGADSHAPAGIMRPEWSRREFGIDRNSSWFYTSQQRAAMRERLTRRVAPSCNESKFE
jgi:hypothetical protein